MQQLHPNVMDIKVPYDAYALAYLWSESPVEGNRAAPIYSDDRFHLPAAPFKIVIKLGHSKMP